MESQSYRPETLVSQPSVQEGVAGTPFCAVSTPQGDRFWGLRLRVWDWVLDDTEGCGGEKGSTTAGRQGW